MTRQKTIKPDSYISLDLHQLETTIHDLEQSPPSSETKTALRAARQTLRQRQREIKARAMEFERTNNQHLLLFDSTENFSKIAGHSVLFYTLTIADQLHRHYNVKPDSDDYSRSEDGIVAIRGLAQLATQLSTLNIELDSELSDTELHFYKLPRAYTAEEIAELRDQSHQDSERIASMLLPHSPLPALHQLILEIERLVYQCIQHVDGQYAREIIFARMLLDADDMLAAYLNFANTKPHAGLVSREIFHRFETFFDQASPRPTSSATKNLFSILLCARDLRNYLAMAENLRLIHDRELCNLLEKIVELEHLTSRAYLKQIRFDSSK